MHEPARVERFPIESAVLRGNPLGDPSRREVCVLVPPAASSAKDSRGEATTRLPVIYVLAGYASVGESLLARGCFEESLDQRFGRLLAKGCPPALLVLPDLGTRLGGAQYLNSSASGRYEDHLVDEIVPEIDRRYRTLGATGRGVVGRSSGGFGALHLAMTRPGLFAAAASHSGDLGFDRCYLPDFPVCARTLERVGGVQPFLREFFVRPKHGSDEFTTISVLAMAAAYSPSSAPDGFDLPFDPQTCELRPAVFARWLARDPARNVGACAAALRSLELLFVDCGTRDEYHLQFGARQFVRECNEHGVPVDHEEFDDSHRGTGYRFDVSIPKLASALGGAPS